MTTDTIIENWRSEQRRKREDEIAAMTPAQLVCAIVEARETLEDAKRNAPSYSGEHSKADFYADEQADFDRVCAAFNAMMGQR